MCTRRERALLVQSRPAGPRVGSRVVDLQDVGGVRPPHSYGVGFNRDGRTEEGIAAAEYPQLACDHGRAWRVDAGGQIGSLRPGVGRNVVVVQRVQVGATNVAPTSYVDVPVDDAKARPSHGDGHARTAGVPGVEHRIVLPYLTKGWIHVTGRISTDHVDFAVIVARTHKCSHVRHRRPGAPRVGGNVVDAGGIDHGGRGDLLPTEHEELVDVRSIHA